MKESKSENKRNTNKEMKVKEQEKKKENSRKHGIKEGKKEEENETKKQRDMRHINLGSLYFHQFSDFTIQG
jgi:hypothetical protein